MVKNEKFVKILYFKWYEKDLVDILIFFIIDIVYFYMKYVFYFCYFLRVNIDDMYVRLLWIVYYLLILIVYF